MIFPLCNITYQQKTLQRTFDFSKKFRKWPFHFTHIPWDQTGQKCIKTELSHIWRVKRPTQSWFLWLSQADESFTKCFRSLNWHCTVNLPYFFCLINRTEKAMAPHSRTLAWKIPWMEEPGRLQSMGSLRVGHDWATSLSLFTFMHWRRKWQPTPVFLPGESQGRGSLVGYHLWGRTELDTTEVT